MALLLLDGTLLSVPSSSRSWNGAQFISSSSNYN